MCRCTSCPRLRWTTSQESTTCTRCCSGCTSWCVALCLGPAALRLQLSPALLAGHQSSHVRSGSALPAQQGLRLHFQGRHRALLVRLSASAPWRRAAHLCSPCVHSPAALGFYVSKRSLRLAGSDLTRCTLCVQVRAERRCRPGTVAVCIAGRRDSRPALPCAHLLLHGRHGEALLARSPVQLDVHARMPPVPCSFSCHCRTHCMCCVCSQLPSCSTSTLTQPQETGV